VTTPPPIDPFTAELLARLAPGSFRPPALMPASLMQPPPQLPSGLGQLAGLLGRMVIPNKKDPPPPPDFLVGRPDGLPSELWQLLFGES
jgi:hypothetical protein